MAQGGGKYDDVVDLISNEIGDDARFALIVFVGDRAEGVMNATPVDMLAIPDVLRNVADSIEADLPSIPGFERTQ